MQLTPHFSLAEMTFTRTGIPNIPTPAELGNIRHMAQFMEEVRAVLGGHPVVITSAFRSARVNSAVGGSPRSHHRRGLAVDFTCPRHGSPRSVVETLVRSKLPFHELIFEFPDPGNSFLGSWVHIAATRGTSKREVLTAIRPQGQVLYRPGILTPKELSRLF